MEDELNNASVLSQWIKSHEHDVVAVNTGEDALRLCRAQSFHMILLDIHLPDISGIEVCHKLRDAGLTENCWLVAFTASLSSNDKQSYLQQGFDAVLGKPVQSQEFKQLLSCLPASLQEDEDSVEECPSVSISCVQGIANCDGDQAFYRQLCNRFVQQYQTIPANEEFPDFVHKLATGAELIGALRLAELACQLCMQDIDEELPDYAFLKAELEMEMLKVIQEIKTMDRFEVRLN